MTDTNRFDMAEYVRPTASRCDTDLGLNKQEVAQHINARLHLYVKSPMSEHEHMFLVKRTNARIIRIANRLGITFEEASAWLYITDQILKRHINA